MEFFPDGAFVRLQSRVRCKYLHADEDGRGVSLSPVRASLNSAWRVHRVVRDDVPFVLLYGAAYGRYLTASDGPAPPGHRGQLVVQGVYDHPAENAVVWTVVEAEDGDYVLLRHISDRLLRANGKHLTWNNGVTVDHPDNQSTMMHWVVEVIPLLPEAPPLQPQVPDVHPGGGFLGLIPRPTVVPLPVRTIRYVRADQNGNFSNDHGWGTFQYEGRCVMVLRLAVADHLGYEFFLYNIRVCTRAGRYGRLSPLITGLPRSHDPMDVIALTMGSPGALALQYPDVDGL